MKTKIKHLENSEVQAKIARRNVILFTRLDFVLVNYFNFERITEETLRRTADRFKFKPPSTKRIKQTLNQASYEQWFEGDICIAIHTSFNPNLGVSGEFTKKVGCGWVHITEKVTERIYSRQFKRNILMEGFIKRMMNEAEFLVNRVKNRPIVPKTSKLFTIKQTYTETLYVSPLNENDTRPFDNGEIPEHLREHFALMDYRNKYYQNIIRPKKGITIRSRDIRKKWKFKK